MCVISCYHLLFTTTVYYIVIYYLLCPDSQHGMPNRTTLTCFRQAIYYSLLSESGGNWSGSHRCILLYFDSAVTIVHLILISLGSVYYSCSQHLHRTGSSYQYTKIDLDLLIKISVILGSFSDNAWYMSLLYYNATKT